MKVYVLLVVLCVFFTTVDARRKKRRNKALQVQIGNGEEENGEANCAKLCSGTTGRGVTEFVAYGNNVYVDVDMSACGFVRIPNVVTSVEGSSHHWMVSGASSVYNTTPTGFRIYLHNESASASRDALNGLNWNIEWMAVGFTC